MNQIFIHGRLTKDVELKDYNNAKGTGKLARLTVACDPRYGEDADFFECSAFGEKFADLLATHFKKGQEILIVGEMTSRRVQNDHGDKVTYWNVNIDRFDFCGKKGENIADSFDQLTEDTPF